MVFAVFDHDSLVASLQTVWKDIAPSAMWTAAANNKLALNEDFSNALDMVKWNATTTAAQQGVDASGSVPVDSNGRPLYDVYNDNRAGFGFSYGSDYSGDYTNAIDAQITHGSNNSATLNSQDLLPEDWDADGGDLVYVPSGFAPIRGENVIYADTLPPFDITLTFASEYGHTAFQKIYDVDILNESSGASIDTVVMARQVTWIARRMSPLVRGVYTRDSAGNLRGVIPTSAHTNQNLQTQR